MNDPEDGHAGVLRIFPSEPGTTRVVLVRHGEAECNINRVVGGMKGDTGLTELGRRQVAVLADRLYESGELRGAAALYSSVLPRAGETAERLRPVVGPGPNALGPVRTRCDLCELHPGECDGMRWEDVVETLRGAGLEPRPEPADRARRRELVVVRRPRLGRGARAWHVPTRASSWWPRCTPG